MAFAALVMLTSLAINFTRKYSSFGFDVDNSKIKLIKKISLFKSHYFKRNKTSKKKGFYATNDFSFVKDIDVIIICVPTPLKKNKNLI